MSQRLFLFASVINNFFVGSSFNRVIVSRMRIVLHGFCWGESHQPLARLKPGLAWLEHSRSLAVKCCLLLASGLSCSVALSETIALHHLHVQTAVAFLEHLKFCS